MLFGKVKNTELQSALWRKKKIKALILAHGIICHIQLDYIATIDTETTNYWF